MKNFTLKNGVEIPCLGFGTYSRAFDFSTAAFLDALDVGYRHIDTASLYMDEDMIGDAIRSSGIPRGELFLTTKVWKTEMGYKKTLQYFEESREKLQTDYVDLFLIHWPVPDFGPQVDATHPGRTAETEGIPWQELCQDTWRALEELYARGDVRAIGVSNFQPHHIMALLETAKVAPMVDQIEFHPGYTQEYTVSWCQKNGIQVEAWRPMAKQFLAQDPLLLELAEKYGKSVAQICIRFALQRNVLPMPSSKNRGRMIENMQVFDFDLSEADLSRLSCLPQTAWSGMHPDRVRAKEG